MAVASSNFLFIYQSLMAVAFNEQLSLDVHSPPFVKSNFHLCLGHTRIPPFTEAFELEKVLLEIDQHLYEGRIYQLRISCLRFLQQFDLTLEHC